MKPKKQTVVINTKIQNINDSGKTIPIKTATVEGEVYYSAVDFLKYLLLLDKCGRHLTLGYIALELRQLQVNSDKFWDDANNAELFEVVLTHLEYYGDWAKGNILYAFFASSIATEEQKLQYIQKMENIPTQTYKLVSQNTKLSPKVRATIISKFKADEEMLLELITTEEEKEVLYSALTQLDISKITSQVLISIYIQESKLSVQKRIELIKKSTSTEILKHLIYNANEFEIVKAARQRLKDIPNSIKLITELAA